jgi:hypothetical protein
MLSLVSFLWLLIIEIILKKILLYHSWKAQSEGLATQQITTEFLWLTTAIVHLSLRQSTGFLGEPAEG